MYIKISVDFDHYIYNIVFNNGDLSPAQTNKSTRFPHLHPSVVELMLKICFSRKIIIIIYSIQLNTYC